MYCGDTSFVKWNPDKRVVVALKCRAWTCPDCAPDRKRALIAQAHRGKPNTFITLTIKRGAAETPDAAALALSQAWRLIAKRALREAARDLDRRPLPAGTPPAEGWPTDANGRVPRQVALFDGKLPYLVVIESHLSGWPHLHILARSRWISHAWLKAQMTELLGSPVVFIQRIDHRGKVAGYVAKYCSKCEHKFGTAKRYWQSQSYELTRYEKPAETLGNWWETYREQATAKQVASRWLAQGWLVTWVSTFKAEAVRGPP